MRKILSAIAGAVAFVALALLVGARSPAADKPEPPLAERLDALLKRYFATTSFHEKVSMQREFMALGPEAVPLLAAKLKVEPFDRACVGWESGPARNTAGIIGHYRVTDEGTAEVLRVLVPMLDSKDRNERGWSTYALPGMPHPGELEKLPAQLSGEKDAAVTLAILYRLDMRWKGSREFTAAVFKESAWRDALVPALEPLLGAGDTETVQLAAECLCAIPVPRVNEIIVDAFRKGKPCARYFIFRMGTQGRPKFTIEQQRAIVPGLIDIMKKYPEGPPVSPMGALMGIPDKRVLPAFFEMLETRKDNREIQRQASYFIWIIFSNTVALQQAIPEEIADFQELGKDPMRSGALWRQWFEKNGERLVWDEQAMSYTLRPQRP